MDIKKVCELIIGKNKLDAKKLAEENGFEFRVTMEDDVSYMITMDFRFKRINVHIENQIVVDAHIG